jgi:alcohol dehydrogenase class IV
MKFEFATANQILFGNGVFGESMMRVENFGKRPLVVCRNDPGFQSFVFETLSISFDEIVLFPVHGEPEVSTVELGVTAAEEGECDFVIGIGGGSVLDTGKAIAALQANGGRILDYLEGIGQGKKLTRKSFPYIAIPTTSGTGSEVTKNAVITSREHGQKASLRSPYMLPDLAVVDPELTYALPPDVTASTGMDALTQLIELVISRKSNPMIESLCLPAIHGCTEALVNVVHHGNDQTGREKMSYGSLIGGIALANSGLGAVHGFAAPIGGMYPIGHGKICACLLPVVFEANWRKACSDQAYSEVKMKMLTAAEAITGVKETDAERAICWLYSLKAELAIPSLEELGVDRKDVERIAQKAETSSSMQGNPVKFTQTERIEILMRAMNN